MASMNNKDSYIRIVYIIIGFLFKLKISITSSPHWFNLFCVELNIHLINVSPDSI